MKAYVVLTTIRVPEPLPGYVDNLKKFGNYDVEFIIINDRETPKQANKKLVETTKNRGFSAEYWDASRQEKWLTRLSSLRRIIPWNSDCRRNIEYLLAYKRAQNGGYEFLGG